MSKRPFSQSYVLSLTYDKLMSEFVFAITKTTQRIADVEGVDNQMEVLETLQHLSEWMELQENFKRNNPDIFGVHK